MNSLIPRVISAAIAILILFVVIFYFQITGLKFLIFAVVCIGGLELVEILFRNNDSRSNRAVFFFFQICIFSLASIKPEYSGLIFAFFAICFCLFSLLTRYKFKDLAELSAIQAKSILGFFYMGLLPSFIFRLVSLPNGLWWFVTLLFVVFAGDIGAYFVGTNIGKKLIMPTVSPKKTFEGAIGGLIGSLLAGVICSPFLPNASLLFLCVLSLAAGVVAQFGDLFESLLKRVADVKDSGRIMPGHGGILDRIDGILFASPIFLFGAILLEKIL